MNPLLMQALTEGNDPYHLVPKRPQYGKRPKNEVDVKKIFQDNLVMAHEDGYVGLDMIRVACMWTTEQVVTKCNQFKNRLMAYNNPGW